MKKDSYIQSFAEISEHGLHCRPGLDEIGEARMHWMAANATLIEIHDKIIRYGNLDSDRILVLVDELLLSVKRVMRYGVEYLWQFEEKRGN